MVNYIKVFSHKLNNYESLSSLKVGVTRHNFKWVKIKIAVMIDFHWFLSQFSTNINVIFQALFSSDAATTLNILVN